MNLIKSTPNEYGGRPHIAGRRITVHNIVVLRHWHHWSVQRIAKELDLSLAEVNAALTYYDDHREEIDQLIEAAEELDKGLPPEIKDKLK